MKLDGSPFLDIPAGGPHEPTVVPITYCRNLRKCLMVYGVAEKKKKPRG